MSVIICARNEAENLKKFLPAVLEQDYPVFEVIVVNDCSEDDSYRVLGEMLIKYPHLKISTINKDPRFSHAKKFAQFIGIRAASYEILLFTDADCYPVSRQWIRSMASDFSPGTDFVLGYGGYIHSKGLLNLYQRWETLFIAVQYMGMAIRGIPYMGVGRNLAYRKEVFLKNRGFRNHVHTASGDDDLFVNTNAKASAVRVEFRPKSHTRSIPSQSLKEWGKRKTRHLSTAKYYKTLHKILLAIEPASRVVFYAFFVILISSIYLWQYVLALFFIRLVMIHIILYINGKKFEEKGILPVILIFDIVSPLINLVLYSGTFRSKKVQAIWK
ncbi:MAG: glycosyltransferase [Bacteroidales bacterium]